MVQSMTGPKQRMNINDKSIRDGLVWFRESALAYKYGPNFLDRRQQRPEHSFLISSPETRTAAQHRISGAST